MANAYTFNMVEDVHNMSVTEIIRDNLLGFVDWGLIDNGGFMNVTLPTSGAYGGNYSRLRPSLDARFQNGQVWEGFRKNWVWESGLTDSPIRISGVYVNGTFQPTSAGGHHINYPLGRVVFDSPISTSAIVNCEFSVKTVQVFDLDKSPELKEIHNGSFRIDDNTFFSSSGNWTIPTDNKIQLPAVGLKVGGRSWMKPYQIGGGHWKYNEVYAYVFSRDESWGNRLADYISYQEEKTINLFDCNQMNEDGFKSLDYKGSVSANPQTYFELVQPSSYAYKTLTLKDIEVLNGQMIGSNVYYNVVKIITEVTMGSD